ncbi:hypothetical protein MBLNU459_g4314t1 [Dothideomycetes sp. NU459]
MEANRQTPTEQADAQVPGQQQDGMDVATCSDARSPQSDGRAASATPGRTNSPAERAAADPEYEMPVSSRSYSMLPPELPFGDTASIDRVTIGSVSTHGSEREFSDPVEFSALSEPHCIPSARPERSRGASFTMHERLAADENSNAESGSTHLSASFASTASTSGERAMFAMDESVPSTPIRSTSGPRTAAELAYEYARKMNKGRIFYDLGFPSTSPLKSTFISLPKTKKTKPRKPKLKLSRSAPSCISLDRGPIPGHHKRKPSGCDSPSPTKAMRPYPLKGGRYDAPPVDE